MTTGRYYSLPDPSGERSDDGAVAELKSAFYESVRLHLRSSREIAACMSGGLDSTNLAWAIHELAPRAAHQFQAFTVNTSGGEKSELEAARSVAQAAGFRHQAIDVAAIS